MAEAPSDQTAWRAMLAPDWREKRKLTDWMGLPSCHDHAHRLMLGAEYDRHHDWLQYAREVHLSPLARRRVGGLTMMSLGCGSGDIEAAVLKANWPLKHLVCAEKDRELLRTAERLLSGLGHECTLAFHALDLDQPFDVGQFDVVFVCHAIHHSSQPEILLRSINRALGADSILLGLDYFGPSRLQMEPFARAVADEAFRLLPPHLRVNLGAETSVVEERFEVPTVDEVSRADPSEAACSSHIRALLFSSFPVIDCRPMGGTLLRQLLARRAGNFVSAEDHCILGLLQMLERALIQGRLIESDDLFFVLGKSTRL
jgi:SAM-dependent methyltransferase